MLVFSCDFTTRKDTNDMKTTFISGKIERENDKAINITTHVQWGSGKIMKKDLWMEVYF